jgi:AcrR family transcriptional regulator
MPESSVNHAASGSLEVRNKILETASALFYQRGARAVGVDLVVAEARVAKTSLYRHFGTKDDLIAAFLAREDEDFSLRAGWSASGNSAATLICGQPR